MTSAAPGFALIKHPVWSRHVGLYFGFVVTADGSNVVVGSGDRYAIMLNADSGEIDASRAFGVQNTHADSLSATYDTQQYAVMTDRGRLEIWGTNPAGVVVLQKQFYHFFHDWNDVRISPAGSVVAFIQGDSVRIWVPSESNVLFHDVVHVGSKVRDVAFSPDVKTLFVACEDGGVDVYDLEQERSVHRFMDHNNDVLRVKVSRDGRWVVTGSSDNTARIWSTQEEYKTKHVLRGHSSAVTCVAISHDSHLVATASNDWTARVWDLESGELLSIIENSSPIRDVEFFPDKFRLATGDVGRNVRVWRWYGRMSAQLGLLAAVSGLPSWRDMFGAMAGGDGDGAIRDRVFRMATGD